MATKQEGHRAAAILSRLAGGLMLALLIVLAVPDSAYAAGGTEVWRLYNRWSGEHLFTTNLDEYDSCRRAGWNGEKLAWTAPASGDEVYRLYNPYSGDHHYARSLDEYNHLGTIGWRKEGVAYHSAAASSGHEVYRLFNPWLTQGTHFFTISKSEYDYLGSIGWTQEGIAWYSGNDNELSAEELAMIEAVYPKALSSFSRGYFGDPIYIFDQLARHDDARLDLYLDGIYTATDWHVYPEIKRTYGGRLSNITKVGDHYVARLATLSYTGNEGSVVYEADPYATDDSSGTPSAAHNWTVRNSGAMLEKIDTIEIWPKGTYIKPNSQMALFRKYIYWYDTDKHEGEPLPYSVFLVKGYDAGKEVSYLFMF